LRTDLIHVLCRKTQVEVKWGYERNFAAEALDFAATVRWMN